MPDRKKKIRHAIFASIGIIFYKILFVKNPKRYTLIKSRISDFGMMVSTGLQSGSYLFRPDDFPSVGHFMAPGIGFCS